MNIKSINFLEARASVNYLSEVFDLELSEEMYRFHIYNLALQLSFISNGSSGLIDHIAQQDDFIEIMGNFRDRYLELMQGSQQ